MKKIQSMFLVGIIILLIMPLIKFNREVPSISSIDNRRLTEFDIYSQDKSEMIDSYIKDRIGLRARAINEYTVLNDKIFGEMIHPSYMYGKEGEVFIKASQELVDTEFVDAFCVYLKKIQVYCNERGVPFIYCLNPGKIGVYSEYLPEGYNYKNKFVTYMETALKKNGVNYINNYPLMLEKKSEGRIYNKKFDAGHWNDLGAFYGINNILKKVGENFPEVKENIKEEFKIEEQIEKSLPVSYFEINETVPLFVNKKSGNIIDRTEEFSDIKIDGRHNTFFCLENEEGENLPDVLFFRGSYMDEKLKFVESKFGQTYAVHNYENLLEFDYYFNIFQPDCVILETAEYATNRDYFNYEKMVNKTLNPVIRDEEREKGLPLSDYNYEVHSEKALTDIVIKTEEKCSGGYLINGDKTFDFQCDSKTGTVFCTIDSQYYNEKEMKVFLF